MSSRLRVSTNRPTVALAPASDERCDRFSEDGEDCCDDCDEDGEVGVDIDVDMDMDVDADADADADVDVDVDGGDCC